MKIHKKQYNMYKHMFSIITLHNFGVLNIINSYQEIIAIKLFFKNRTDNLKEEHKIGTPLHTADTISSSVLLMKHMSVTICQFIGADHQ